MKRTPLTLLVILSCYVIGMTQTPQTISYQGLLYDARGKLLKDASYPITFKLYDKAIAGTPLWTESQTLATAQGVFSATLGSVQPITLPFDVPYWLSVQVGTGTELMPRINLTSVPYSFRAHAVDNDAVVAKSIRSGQVVKSINGLRDSITFIAGNNVALTKGNSSVTIDVASTPFPTSDNMLFPSGYAEEFIVLDPEKAPSTVPGALAPDVFEVPKGMALRFQGNPTINTTPSSPGGAASKQPNLYIGFIGGPQPMATPDVGKLPCPITFLEPPRGASKRCDFLYAIKEGLVIPPLTASEEKSGLKRYYQIFMTTTNPNVLSRCPTDTRFKCPTINAVLVPRITNFVLLTYRPREERDPKLVYTVPAGYKLIINRIGIDTDWIVRAPTSSPYISINKGTSLDPSKLPLPYVLKSGTEIALTKEIPPGVKGSLGPWRALTIQGYLKPN